MTKIEEVSVLDIRFDKSQPRRFIDETKVEEMAKSIITQGVINPIEIDEKNTIVTGELRFRATCKAGLRTIPCKRIKISDDERFERQVIENVHHNTMSPWDTAKALEKLLSTSDPVRSPKQGRDAGISKLARKIGKSEKWIRESLMLLDSGEEFKKALKKNKIGPTFIRIAEAAPEKYRKILEKKVLNNEIPTRDVGRQLAVCINDYPEKADELLALDLKGLTTETGLNKIRKVILSSDDKALSMICYCEKVEELSERLMTLLDHPPESMKGGGLIEAGQQRVVIQLKNLYDKLAPWFEHKLKLTQPND